MIRTYAHPTDCASAVHACASAMLASRPQGICLNGSTLDAKAGSTGYQAVNPTDVARQLQEAAGSWGKRWRNCNHDTVASARGSKGWMRVYAARKLFMFRDATEAARCSATYQASVVAKRSAAWEQTARLRAIGPTARIEYLYAAPKGYYRGTRKRRVLEVPAATVLDACAKLAAGKAVFVQVTSFTGDDLLDRYVGEAQRWTWKRPVQP